jgi:hypothetical protein
MLAAYSYNEIKLNKLILYYFKLTFFILFFMFKMVVLDGNFALGCGPETDYP